MIRLHLLGALRLEADVATARRAVLAQPRRAALLAYLALRARHGPERRDTLLGVFWPESTTNHARGALRNALHFLRVSLGPDVIRSYGSEEVHLDLERVWCDAVAFDQLCDAGDGAAALQFYDGDLLEGFFVSDAPVFEAWLEQERSRLRQRAILAARRLASEAETAGEPGLAELRLRKVLQLSPTDETATRELMRLLVAAGDRGHALQIFAELEAKMADDYGLQPAPETQALAASIRSARMPLRDTGAAAAAAAASAAASAGTQSEATRPAATGPKAAAAAQVEEARMAGGAASSPSASAGQAPERRRETMTALAGEAAGSRPVSRAWLLLAAAAILAALVPVGAAALRLLAPRPAGSVDLVAVLPFDYRGAVEHAYLAEGMADLLAANLHGAGELRAVDPRALLPRLHAVPQPIDPPLARREAAAHGAGLFVLGSVTEAGGQLRIAATLYGSSDRVGSAARDVVVEGHADDVLALVDRLSLGLLQRRGTTALVQSALRTTVSVEALKAFLSGEAALRRTDVHAAVDHFRQATHLDSTFALAHYRLSSAAYRQGVAGIPASAAAAALRHAPRLVREDSLLVAAWHHHVTGSVAEARQLYEEALVLRPSHVEAAYQLGELIFHWGSRIGIPAAEASEPFRRVLSAEPGNVETAVHLARLAAREGRVGEVDSLVSLMDRAAPDGAWRIEMAALRAFLARDVVRQDRAIDAAGSQPNRDRAILESMAAFSYELDAVERLTRARLGVERAPVEQARMQLFLAHVQLANGRHRAARDGIATATALPLARRLEYRAMMAALPFLRIDRAELEAVRAELAMMPKLELREEGGPFAGRGIEYPHLLWPGLFGPRRLYLLGALHIRLEDLDAARAVADSLAAYDPNEPLAFEYERVTRARILAAEGRHDEALRTLGPPRPPPLRTFESLVDHDRPFERWLRAELLHATGRYAEALRWYGTFPDPVARDLAYLAPAHLRRAEIHDALGNAEQAAFHYRRFSELWADADAMLQAAVSAARERTTARGAAATDRIPPAGPAGRTPARRQP